MSYRRGLGICLLGLIFHCQAENSVQLLKDIQQLRTQLQQFEPTPSTEVTSTPTNTPINLHRSIQHIALLLPLSGRFGSQSTLIQQGFQHAWAADKNPLKPKLSILDTQLNPANIHQYYQKALALGADFMVGPLHKEAIHRLSLYPLHVPILALNIIDQQDTLSPNIWQMGLSPEQEIRQILDAIYLQGHRHLLVLLAANEQGDRLQKVIKNHWTDSQHTLSLARYDVQHYDLDLAIQRLVHADHSVQRIAELQTLLKEPLSSLPHSRQDSEALLIAAPYDQLLQVRPLLQFYRHPTLPIYATSQVLDGFPVQQPEQEMDHIYFTAIPTLNLAKPPLSQQRLHALGEDAYQILSDLAFMQNDPDHPFSGKSGTHQMLNQQLIRQLHWFRLRQGRISASPYRDRP
jgi:uncharacterized protein